MAGDQPRYYRVKRNDRAYWEPGQFGRSLDFQASVPLGEDGPEAKKLAIDWNAKLDRARRDKKNGVTAPKPYPPGSLGSFYERFRQTEAWGQMEPTSRADYTRVWPHIEKRFGHTLITKITPDDSERFHVDIHPQHPNRRDPDGALKLPWNTAHRTLKIWRALLTALVAYRLLPPPAPVGRVSNPAPPGRSQTWAPEEVPTLIATAKTLQLHGIALVIRLIYDGMLSPVDGRLITAGAWVSSVDGGQITKKRKKTERVARVAMSEDAAAAIADYLAVMAGAGIQFEPDDFLILSKTLTPYDGTHGRKYFERDFRKVREAAFPGDRRQMLDLRRTGATEALEGGADPKDIGKTMANNLDSDDKLSSTYLVAGSRRVQDARTAGRVKRAAKQPKAPE